MLLKRLVRETSTSEIKAPMTFPGLKDSEQNRFFGRKKIDFALKPKLLLNLLKLLLQKTQTFVYRFFVKEAKLIENFYSRFRRTPDTPGNEKTGEIK